MRRILIAWLATAALALPAVAGIVYQARTWQEGDQTSDAAAMTVKAVIDGDKAKIEFEESGNPWMGKGSYLLTTDGGRTLYLVKPEDKTYGAWDLEAVMRMVGQLGSGGLLNIQIDNPRVETLEAGAGKTVAGLATRHHRYRSSYDLEVKIIGIKKRQTIDSIQDVWSTEALDDAALGVWLRTPKTGHEDLDRLIELEATKIKGFPLEVIDRTTTTDKKGRGTTTVTHTLVTELEQGVAVPAETFVIPPDYTQTQLMPTDEMAAAGGEDGSSDDEEEEEKGGLLGRFKRLGKKDG